MIRISDTRLAEWFEQMADALDAGMDYSNAVALAQSLPRQGSARLTAELETGVAWTTALSRSELDVSDAEFAALAAAEQSASSPAVFRRLAASRRDRAKTRRRVAFSLLYPVLLLHMAAVAFPAGYIVEGKLTEFFVAVGMVLVPFWLIAAFLAMLFRFFPSALRGGQRFVPFLRACRNCGDMARLCDTLAICLRAGMSVDHAWEAGVAAADNPLINRMGEGARRAIGEGRPVSVGIAEASETLPGSFLQLYRGGESVGRLEQNLEAAAQAYDRDAKSKLFVGTMVYSKLLVVAVFGYVAYRIVGFFADYYDRLMEIGM